MFVRVLINAAQDSVHTVQVATKRGRISCTLHMGWPIHFGVHDTHRNALPFNRSTAVPLNSS